VLLRFLRTILASTLLNVRRASTLLNVRRASTLLNVRRESHGCLHRNPNAAAKKITLPGATKDELKKLSGYNYPA
jgi:hypothetical protein